MMKLTHDNRLLVIVFVNGSDATGQSISENHLMELHVDGAVSTAVRVPLKKPFTDFFTATVRAGSPASDLLELLGTQQGIANTVCYARIRLK